MRGPEQNINEDAWPPALTWSSLHSEYLCLGRHGAQLYSIVLPDPNSVVSLHSAYEL